MSQWIWRYGEFECYHNMILHTRRQQYGYPEPVVWKLYAPEPVVCFKKEVTTEGGTFRIHALGNISVIVGAEPWNQKKYGGQREIKLEPGTTTVLIRVANTETFPCIYVDGVIESDDTWLCDDMSQDWKKVGTSEMFVSPDQTPDHFPFSYLPVSWVKKEKVEGGVLFDFGKETFARTRFSGLGEGPVKVRFGESREEAMDPEWCVIRFEDKPEKGVLSYIPYAFRYLFVSDEKVEVKAEYEYLPLEYKGSFHCSEEIINKVWDVAAYTFHLNSREFFLDGIKRDRWVWSADAYQSLFVNRYLFFDKEIEKRTLIALGEEAEKLRKQIFEKFYDTEKKVFIDSYESGKRNVTRQSNILAYLFLSCDDTVKKDIYERVVLNDEVPQITTPYFKFYENQVHCKAGNTNLLEKSIREYYGSMLATGATTLYEEYDPTMTGVEHYAMYGNPFEKSLCHAWSASPIYLLGNFRLGVENTGIAYDTFDVRPNPGDLKGFHGKVPVPGGTVSVSVDQEEIRVYSEIPGGTLYVDGKAYTLEAKKECRVRRKSDV